MNQKEYAVLPPDSRVVTEFEKLDLKEAQTTFANVAATGWKLVKASNYPCGQDDMGTTLFPIFSILKVKP